MIFPNQTNGPQTTGSQSTRPGLTLVEVLATIFILAVGSLSILVLFPVGAMKVKAALNNTRIALVASNGLANLKILVKMGFLDPNPDRVPKSFWYFETGSDNKQVALFDQTAQMLGFEQGLVHYPRSSTALPNSYIPVNFKKDSFPISKYLINPTLGEIAKDFRKNWFSLQDDIEWDPSGSVRFGAVGPAVPVAVRGQAFSTAYLIRRYPQLSRYDVTILVYHGRSPNLYDSGNDKVLSGFIPPIPGAGNTGDLALALITLPTKDDARTLAKGSWIVETTNREYEYYQIQSITEAKDVDRGPYFRLELDRPLVRNFSTTPPTDPEFFWVDFLGGVFPKGQVQFN